MPGNPSFRFFPRLVMHMSTLRTALQFVFYLGTMEEAPVSAYCNLPSGIVFMVDIWESSRRYDEVGTLV